ncbi:MAG: phage holin family protein [Lactobacillales bacterium]|jgi:putative membrane protein|nr:phage holin family protein [Lactobacillales bacterium]
MSFIGRLVVTILVFMGYSVFFPQRFHLAGFGVAVLAALVLSVLNTILKPILSIFSLPFLLLTFGLFSFVISAIMLQITSYVMGSANFGFSSFGSSLILAILLSVVNSVVTQHNRENE